MKTWGATPLSVDWNGGIRDGNRGMARPASRRRHRFGDRGDRHRRRRHDRRRRVHQPRLPGQGHPVRLCDPAPLDCRRPRRFMRGVLLRELGAMFPRSSGEYNFLSRAFHPAFGFLAGWVSATVGFAAPVALAAMAFGEYGKSVLPCTPPLALAVGVVWLVSIVQLAGIRQSSTFQLIATSLKVVLIIAFLIAGFAVGTPQPLSFAPQVADFARIASAPFAIGLVFVMYSFSGWNAATYIIGEMRHAAAEPAARAARRDADRAGAVCGAERGVPAHHADRQAFRSTRRCPHRRQLTSSATSAAASSAP